MPITIGDYTFNDPRLLGKPLGSGERKQTENSDETRLLGRPQVAEGRPSFTRDIVHITLNDTRPPDRDATPPPGQRISQAVAAARAASRTLGDKIAPAPPAVTGQAEETDEATAPSISGPIAPPIPSNQTLESRLTIRVDESFSFFAPLNLLA